VKVWWQFLVSAILVLTLGHTETKKWMDDHYIHTATVGMSKNQEIPSKRKSRHLNNSELQIT